MLYNVTDTYTGQTLTNVTAKEVREYLSKPKLNITRLLYTNCLYLQRFDISVAEEEEKDVRVNENIPPELFQEWGRVTRQYQKKVEWVKKEDYRPGVKIL